VNPFDPLIHMNWKCPGQVFQAGSEFVANEQVTEKHGTRENALEKEVEKWERGKAQEKKGSDRFHRFHSYNINKHADLAEKDADLRRFEL